MRKDRIDEFFFRHSPDGEVIVEAGSIVPWAPQLTDPFGPAVLDSARDLELIELLESLPLNMKAVAKRNGSNAERQEIEHVIRVIAHLNERIGYTKYSYSRTETSFIFRRIR